MKLLLTHLLLLSFRPHSPSSFAPFLSFFRALFLHGFRSCRDFDAYIMFVVSETPWRAERLQNAIFHDSRLSSLLLQCPRCLSHVCGTSPIHHGHLRRKWCDAVVPTATLNATMQVLVEPRNKLPWNVGVHCRRSYAWGYIIAVRGSEILTDSATQWRPCFLQHRRKGTLQ